MIEKDIENRILQSLSEAGVSCADFGGLWQEDKTERPEDAVIVRVVVNPLSLVDGKTRRTTVEIAVAVRRECDPDGTLFSTVSETLLETLGGWMTDYHSAVEAIRCEGFIPSTLIVTGSDGNVEIESDPISNLTTEVDWDENRVTTFLKATFSLQGVIV
ncbi:MAG: hypothetical protein IJR99_06915 [Kiritimatiellae bacterium]|nr:hypothetical protein [Kiritimatiellia bacterium]